MERTQIPGACQILGVSARTIQRLAVAGQLPSAVKVGRVWTFDIQALRTWLREQEVKPCQHIERRKPQRAATGGARSYGPASPSEAKSTVSASRQAIRQLREIARQQSTPR
ncbi:helix-turn-helix domain-containing protein [Methylobacterium sp. IF7SW-B2]|nr:helix-turn-helix domain-containing protein [Methylobacterium ajmalii]MBK3412765.1 helix-turn-helix domain-containing protein [Methylobacterium ajmalii]MBK3423256.1 helix-turn-helix domain-containing protein [Methylobacterium ajmalii]